MIFKWHLMFRINHNKVIRRILYVYKDEDDILKVKIISMNLKTGLIILNIIAEAPMEYLYVIKEESRLQFDLIKQRM